MIPLNEWYLLPFAGFQPLFCFFMYSLWIIDKIFKLNVFYWLQKINYSSLILEKRKKANERPITILAQFVQLVLELLSE